MKVEKIIEGLNILKGSCQHRYNCMACDVCCNEVYEAIKALEEYERYKAIGTVEEFASLKNNT